MMTCVVVTLVSMIFNLSCCGGSKADDIQNSLKVRIFSYNSDLILYKQRNLVFVTILIFESLCILMV